MQSQTDGKNKKRPSVKKYAELNEDETIELLAEIIANRIIEKILDDENTQPTIEQINSTGSQKGKAV